MRQEDECSKDKQAGWMDRWIAGWMDDEQAVGVVWMDGQMDGL